MATGPEHYRAAERLLFRAAQEVRGGLREKHLFMEAQVHATLALAAGVAGLDASEGPGGGSATGRTVEEANEWARAIAPLVPAEGLTTNG
jgi:hypothetical protein